MKSILILWKQPEHFSRYLISNIGECVNIHQPDKPLKPLTNKDGYLYFNLTGDDNKNHTCYIHRLVAKAFVNNDDPDNKREINHINQDKTNNWWNNLEWCDRKYNMNYLDIKDRIANTMTNHPDHSKSVYQFTLGGQFVAEYPSLSEVERQLHIDHSKISLVCNGKRRKAGGYIWKFKN